MSKHRLLLLVILVFTGVWHITIQTHAQSSLPLILVLTGDGPITPAMREYLHRGIKIAEQRSAEALIFQLNTPGGNIEPMNTMVQDIRLSTVPVVIYVQPRGAMAASAGTVITLAGHVAAMAPETTIGAASPVGAQGEDLGQTMEEKVKNMLKATVRSLAERRGKQAVALAESTIDSARAISANEAYQAGLVDFIANDLADLIKKLDGFQVELATGSRTIHTQGATSEQIPISLIEQLLTILTNPNIVFLLLTIGVQAVLIELYSPGGWIAGFIGVVCISLAMYGLGVLPVNWFGLLFLLLSFVLFILDIKAPTHGALTAAGVGSLIIGSLVLFNSPGVPSFQRVSVPLVISVSTMIGILFTSILVFALRAQKSPVRTGLESLIGRVGIARTEINPSGNVQVGGELWTAELEAGAKPIPAGSRVRVTGKEGIHITVKKLEEES
ncbi:MAG: NfeD family protein [Anaerolineales bacterium]